MLLEYRRLEPKYPNRAGRGCGGGGRGVEGGLILEMGLSSVKCGAMFGNNHREIRSLFQSILLVPPLRMHPDLWGAGLQQLQEGF